MGHNSCFCPALCLRGWMDRRRDTSLSGCRRIDVASICPTAGQQPGPRASKAVLVRIGRTGRQYPFVRGLSLPGRRRAMKSPLSFLCLLMLGVAIVTFAPRASCLNRPGRGGITPQPIMRSASHCLTAGGLSSRRGLGLPGRERHVPTWSEPSISPTGFKLRSACAAIRFLHQRRSLGRCTPNGNCASGRRESSATRCFPPSARTTSGFGAVTARA